MKSYFILGTDTNCGKTYVTCQLLRALQAENQNAVALKPVTSGCIEQNGVLISDDAACLAKYMDRTQDEICPWRLRLPISPHLAAQADGQSISAQMIVDFCTDQSFETLDYLLIEGAGGLMVPLNEQETWVDVLIQSKIQVILVVGMRLGCINHALLTALALKSHNIACAGWIANCIDNDMLALSENITTLSNKLDSPLLAVVPFAEESPGPVLTNIQRFL